MDIFIAIDHQESSLIKYLDKQVISDKEFKNFRHTIIKTASGIVDGLIVREEEFDFGFKYFKNDRLIIGLPDVDDIANSKNIDVIKKEIYQLRKKKTNTVKLGFNVSTKINFKSYFFRLINSIPNNFNIIAEPYFSNSLSLKSKIFVLEQIKSFNQITSLKLGISDNRMIEAYGQIKDCSWYARSSNLGYSNFIKQFNLAYKNGCIGLIVGRAIWGEAIKRFYSNNIQDIEYLESVKEKILSIKQNYG